MKRRAGSPQRVQQARVRPFGSWADAALWGAGVGAFAYALARALAHPAHDLRTAPLLALDALLAMGLALGYAVRNDALEGRPGVLRCWLYGLWSAAVFHLLPALSSEAVIFHTQHARADPLLTPLLAVAHGAAAAVLAFPFARRALQVDIGSLRFADDDSLELSLVTVLLFFIIAAAVRLLALPGW